MHKTLKNGVLREIRTVTKKQSMNFNRRIRDMARIEVDFFRKLM